MGEARAFEGETIQERFLRAFDELLPEEGVRRSFAEGHLTDFNSFDTSNPDETVAAYAGVPNDGEAHEAAFVAYERTMWWTRPRAVTEGAAKELLETVFRYNPDPPHQLLVHTGILSEREVDQFVRDAGLVTHETEEGVSAARRIKRSGDVSRDLSAMNEHPATDEEMRDLAEAVARRLPPQ